MQSHPLKRLGCQRMGPQHSVHLNCQHARHYMPSAHHRAPQKVPKSKHLRFHSPPAVAPKSRPYLLKVSRAPDTDVPRWSWPESRWYKWATKHTYISGTLVLFICGGITFSFVGVKRVPITGRNQLEYVPKWVEIWAEKEMHNENEEQRKRTADCSWRAGDPGMQVPIAILNRLLRASGLEDREWELRIVNAPCK